MIIRWLLTNGSWDALKSVLMLAAPIVMGQLAQTGMGFVDTVMAGQVSSQDLAAVALGTAVWLPIYLFASGVLLVLTPFVAQSIGASNPIAVKKYLWQGVVLAFILGLISSAVLASPQYWLVWFALEPAVFLITVDYLHALSWGVLFALWFQVIRFFHDAHGFTRIAMWLSFVGFLVNIPLNYVFVYGWGYIPAMGGAGCGVATSLSYLVMFGLGWLWFFRHQVYRAHHQFWTIIDWQAIWKLFKSGLPIASAILFEVGLFIFIAFLVAPLGTTVLAAHQVAISYTSIVFMLPLSLAMAVTVRIGQLTGEGALDQVRALLVSTLLFSFLLGLLIAGMTYWWVERLANIYSNDIAVVALAMTLMVFAAMYQVSDAIQVVCAGALRGVVDTVAVMWITFFAYWLLALPLGYLLCYPLGWGVEGFWISFVVGLTVAAIGLLWRLHWRFWGLGSVVSR